MADFEFFLQVVIETFTLFILLAMGIAMENLALWVANGVAIGGGFDASNKKK